MNYEVNPFQDYESITVDELKDQANSLLKSGNGRAAATARMYE